MAMMPDLSALMASLSPALDPASNPGGVGMGPEPAPSASPASSPNFGAILKQIMPAVLSGIAMKQGGKQAAGAMLQGYQEQLARARQMEDAAAERAAANARDEQERQDILRQREQARREKSGLFLQNVAKDASQFTDPTTMAKYMELATKIGKEVYGLSEEDVRGVAAFNEAGALESSRDEATKLVEKLQNQHGDQFADLVESGASMMFKGKQTPLSDILSLANVPMMSSPINANLPLGMRGGMAPVTVGQKQTPVLPQPKEDAASSDYGRFLVRFAKERGKKVADLTTAEELDARKTFSQVDDRTPKGTDPVLAQIRALQLQQMQSQGMTPQQFTQANALRDDFRTESKDYMVREGQFRVIKSVATAPASAAGDLSLIFAYMKMLDPGSVVREGEQASAANAAGVPDRVRNLYNRIMSGERLNPQQRADFLTQASRMYQGSLREQKRRIASYTQRASAAKVPVEMVTAEPDPDLEDTGGASFSVVAPDGKTYTFPSQAALDTFKKNAGIK